MTFRPRQCCPASSRLPLLLLLIALPLFAIACGVDLANPPRLATRQAAPPTLAAEALILPAPTATPGGAGVDTSTLPLSGTSLSIWVNETSPEHRALLQEVAMDFAAETGADVAVQLVAPSLLPELVSTGVLSGTLPDLILMPQEHTVGWAEDGILDPGAAADVVATLGPETFDADALELVQMEGGPAAIPHDGYHQLLLYRADWFEERGLLPPDTYAAMASAAERIFDREAIISGLIIPTESNLVTTHQAFEQLALANDCRLIDEAGNVTILSPACRETLDHYYTTINRFSPPGVQTDTSARVGFLDGRTSMIMTSPAILPALAGLDPNLTAGCDECEDDPAYLAANTGILTDLRAGAADEAAAFGNLNYLGITTAADREAAQAFARYWYSEAYPRWLAIEPERKVPMRLGTADEPRRYIDAWGTEPLPGSDRSLADIFGEQTVAQLRDNIASAPRWGFREGQGALMSRLYEDYTLSIVLQEMLSGYFSPERTLEVASQRVLEKIPGALPPTPTPEPTIDPAATPTTTP